MKNLVINSLLKKYYSNSIKNSIRAIFILTFFILMGTLNSYGQNSRLILADEILKEKGTSANTFSSTEATIVKSFLRDLKPSVYINNQVVDAKSDSPICLYTDLKSVKSINSLGISSKSVEFVSIKIKSKNELYAPIDMTIFNEFSNLKYILLVFEFNVTASDLSKVVTNTKENQYILYKVEIQS